MPAPDLALHATCVVLGEAGILVRGASGAGKSTLARMLILEGEGRGAFARLVADDRVALRRRHGRLLASPVTPLEGLLEIRGRGIIRLPYEPVCVVRLVIDLGGEAPRLPDEASLVVDLAGLLLPRRVAPTPDIAAALVAWHLRGPDDTIMTEV